MTFVIEKGIPIKRMVRNKSSTRFPFAELEVGDSFEIPTEKRNSLATWARQWAIKNGKVFTVRATENGIRIWRRA
jgi:hypothetical protein